MPIYRLLQNMPIGPEEIGRLTTAYEQALRAIGIVDRGDPLAELLARNHRSRTDWHPRARRHLCLGDQGNRHPNKEVFMSRQPR
ncbi:hypothetical protein [Bradyrhizobium valentinum]|uniref:hypothetical protein n=1 Tax=Bradyrhizobium valentinum TaxID=1518501 RepID=UPI000A833E29|nr:hypothetical protein [Bradyrhizobium valentinum]